MSRMMSISPPPMYMGLLLYRGWVNEPGYRVDGMFVGFVVAVMRMAERAVNPMAVFPRMEMRSQWYDRGLVPLSLKRLLRHLEGLDIELVGTEQDERRECPGEERQANWRKRLGSPCLVDECKDRDDCQNER